jgi:hypothetical protein
MYMKITPVKLRTTQDTSLLERVENNTIGAIHTCWHVDVAYTMYNVVCRSMTIYARYAASVSGSVA